MIRYQDFFLPCCHGWHTVHLRARVGTYYHWLLERLREIG